MSSTILSLKVKPIAGVTFVADLLEGGLLSSFKPAWEIPKEGDILGMDGMTRFEVENYDEIVLFVG